MTIEKIDHLTDSLKDELIGVWEKSVRSSHHFLSEEDLGYYRPRIRDIYFDAVDLYVIRNPNIAAFMGLSEDMVEMLFVLPSESDGNSLRTFPTRLSVHLSRSPSNSLPFLLAYYIGIGVCAILLIIHTARTTCRKSITGTPYLNFLCIVL